MTVSLIKDSIKINDAARPRVCREVLENMGPQIELNFSPGRWAGNGAPLIAFPQGSELTDDSYDCEGCGSRHESGDCYGG